MKISQKLLEAERENRTWWSFEYFPPRTAQGLQNLLDRIERMRGYGPEFIDITWNAGGRTSDLSSELVRTCQGLIGIETVMHLTCTNMPAEKVDAALRDAKEAGCRNILALRGDPPAGQDTWTKTEGGFEHGIDLVRHIRKTYGDYFEIAVAGFPQHVELPAEEFDREIEWLKEKIDAGCGLIFTQMFYDVDLFFRWVRAIRKAGIIVPIIPGINPIQTWNGLMKSTKLSDATIPQSYFDALEPVKNDDEQVRAIGTRLIADMCRSIIGSDLGIRGVHIYTMNLEKATRMLLQELDLVPRIEVVKPLPWRQSLTPSRRTETIRPIFWANRTKSYLSRTENWDEYPNGRFGDSRSPAYGGFEGYGVSINKTKEEGKKLWGEPTSLEQIKELFARYCMGDVTPLPWSDQGPAAETGVISQQLVDLNRGGYLTINSQPAVNGAPSSDKVHGWGPANGYVYQKAYLEFFVSSAQLSSLINQISRDSNITYYAINKQGDLKTNNLSEGPNAVTWGVFPGKEILQPTIVEAVSFMAWKDEAFELGRQWAQIYDAGSPSRELIEEMMDTYFLVNIVHNDFKDANAIFQPFLALVKGNHGANGVASKAADDDTQGADSKLASAKVANGVVPADK